MQIPTRHRGDRPGSEVFLRDKLRLNKAGWRLGRWGLGAIRKGFLHAVLPPVGQRK